MFVHEDAAARAQRQPRALARPLSGETPMARMTISAAMAGPTSTFVTTCPSRSSKPVTAQPSRSEKPLGAELGVDKGGHVRVQRA